jgi:hypothetical protein
MRLIVELYDKVPEYHTNGISPSSRLRSIADVPVRTGVPGTSPGAWYHATAVPGTCTLLPVGTCMGRD